LFRRAAIFIFVAIFAVLITRCGYTRAYVEAKTETRHLSWSVEMLEKRFGKADEIRRISAAETEHVYFDMDELVKGLTIEGFPPFRLHENVGRKRRVFTIRDGIVEKEIVYRQCNSGWRYGHLIYSESRSAGWIYTESKTRCSRVTY